MPARHFATKRDVAPAPETDFSVDFVRDGVVEVHEFAARPRLTYAETLGLIKHSDDAKVLPYVDRMIRKALRDDDGTPAKWEPRIVDGHFKAPNGDHTPADQAARLLAFEAGSSRRRWIHLMEVDDDVEVDLAQIVEAFEFLAGEAANRPT